MQGIEKNIFPWLCAAMCVVLVLACLKYGPAVTPDSVTYLSTGKSLAFFNGFTRFDGAALLNWAPLYPLLLAPAYLAHLPATGFALALNCVAFMVIVFFTRRLLAEYLQGSMLPVALLFCCASPVLFKAGIGVYSELIFMALQAVFIYYFNRYLATRSGNDMLLASAMMGLMCLQRYAGLLCFSSSAIIIFFIFGSGRKLKDMVAYVFIALLPVAAWFFYNYMHANAPAGSHQIADKLSLTAIAGNAASVAAFHRPLYLLFFGVLAVTWIYSLVALNKSAQARLYRLPALLLWCYCSMYLALLFMQAQLGMAELPRYLGVLWVPFSIYMCLFLDLLFRNPNLNTHMRKLYVVLIMGEMVVTGSLCRRAWTVGAGGFHDVHIMDETLIHYINQSLPENCISNYPDFIWLVSEKPAMFSCYVGEDAADFKKRVAGARYLFWINKGGRTTVMRPQGLPLQIYPLYTAVDSTFVLYGIR